MNAVLISLGTDGDILPYVGLGVVLRGRGHSVTLLASGAHEPLARAHGFAFQPLVSAGENHELLGHPDFWNPLKTAPLSARWCVRFLRRQYDLVSRLATRDTVLVSSPAVFAASLVNETQGVPLANLILQPWIIRSSIAPPTLPFLRILSRAPRAVWRLFWLGLDRMGDILVGRELNSLRAELGLRPMRRIFRNWLSRQRVIGMFPDWYGPPPADWPSQVRLAGFPLFDGGRDEGLPSQVLDFCRAGPPPVVLTFGTGMVHSAALFRAALEACGILGLRGIVLTKYRHQLPASLPPSVFPWPFARFEKLFPHCAAVVHHGGIGTVAEAMAAGIPQLIRPICFDQADNGVRVKRLGAGDVLPDTRAGGSQIASALAALMTREARDRCRRFAARFNRTSALETAADLVEALSVPSEASARKDGR